ncbi:hypothetical protein BC629DRAFT_1443805 [Irpex lacteus]|nr:hypothetical protein BC629DRAFT_1443805 [Irpex lacteus]
MSMKQMRAEFERCACNLLALECTGCDTHYGDAVTRRDSSHVTRRDPATSSPTLVLPQASGLISEFSKSSHMRGAIWTRHHGGSKATKFYAAFEAVSDHNTPGLAKLANVVDEDRSPILATAARPPEVGSNACSIANGTIRYRIRRYLPYISHRDIQSAETGGTSCLKISHRFHEFLPDRSTVQNPMAETSAWKQQTLVIWYGCAGAAVYRIINRHARINNFAFDVHGMVMEDPEEPRSESGPLFKPAGVREIPIEQHCLELEAGHLVRVAT